jgi:glycosyltransferase involved in cell wall biosynthesis
MAISVDKINGGLPISVIIPLSKNREDFFYNMVLPMLESNEVNEIIINDNDGKAPKKRNDGFKKATQPYVFFCDDDIILPMNYLESLYNELDKNSEIGFTYTGYKGIVMYPETHPMHGNFEIPSIEFSEDALKYGNYISTMSLLRRNLFNGFDETLNRLQDWDLWLSLVEKGIKGKLVKDLTFYAYYLDSGITSNSNSEIDAYNKIRTKHNLLNL